MANEKDNFQRLCDEINQKCDELNKDLKQFAQQTRSTNPIQLNPQLRENMKASFQKMEQSLEDTIAELKKFSGEHGPELKKQFNDLSKKCGDLAKELKERSKEAFQQSEEPLRTAKDALLTALDRGIRAFKGEKVEPADRKNADAQSQKQQSQKQQRKQP
jgi:septation ring formation regulator EzrA